MRTIQYAIDINTGLIVSRVDTELGCYVVDYENMNIKNGYSAKAFLVRIPILHTTFWDSLRWTKKIPKEIKNIHRNFWGFPALK